MEIIKIDPQGYCNGVLRALKLVDELLADDKAPKPIYMLGHIIHNKEKIKEYQAKGIIILEDKSKTKKELISTIPSGTVIFSAHGIQNDVYQVARQKELAILDATCPKVMKIQKLIKQYLNDGYETIYIGTKGHPECEGILGISSKINLVTSILDIESLALPKGKPIYATNQTTLSKYDLEDCYKALKNKYPQIVIDDSICLATQLRQDAMAKQKNIDLCLVVGDRMSSNTNKLVEVSKKIANVDTILVETVDDLTKEMFQGKKRISISSGASTPSEITNAVIDYVKAID